MFSICGKKAKQSTAKQQQHQQKKNDIQCIRAQMLRLIIWWVQNIGECLSGMSMPLTIYAAQKKNNLFLFKVWSLSNSNAETTIHWSKYKKNAFIFTAYYIRTMREARFFLSLSFAVAISYLQKFSNCWKMVFVAGKERKRKNFDTQQYQIYNGIYSSQYMQILDFCLVKIFVAWMLIRICFSCAISKLD